MMQSCSLFIFMCIYFFQLVNGKQFCTNEFGEHQRYLLYNVNPGEGFNLRRDVYIRISNLIRRLNEIEPWALVLPPWGGLYHWRNMPPSSFLPWNNFFDVQSLKKWIPVMEFEEFYKMKLYPIDSAVILQNYPSMLYGEWEDKYVIAECHEKPRFKKLLNGTWSSLIFNIEQTFSDVFCLSFMGHASSIIPFLTEELRKETVYLDHAEVLLHDEFGQSSYWSARRSMRFAKGLVDVADEFRLKFLESSNEKDGTQVAPDWKDFKPKRKRLIGGPYIAVHLRRTDFVRARRKNIPSIKFAARQLRKVLQMNRIRKLFIASDAPQREIDELRLLLEEYDLFQFLPSHNFFDNFGDGGAAIVDQIVCSHSRYFIGTYESTFSFRIQEEREILGFVSDMTFNRLCGDEEGDTCDQPTRWNIVYS